MKKYFIQKSPFIVPTTDGKLIEEHHGKVAANNDMSTTFVYLKRRLSI
jgi:ethanolamine utilization protein EutQ